MDDHKSHRFTFCPKHEFLIFFTTFDNQILTRAPGGPGGIGKLIKISNENLNIDTEPNYPKFIHLMDSNIIKS